jgi:hypothetical protein
MYKLDKKRNLQKIDKSSFKSLDIKENEIELLIKNNIEIFSEEEQSLLIIGQQVINKSKGRSDLICLDSDGNLVLFEIKRDRTDIERRSEPFETQAIRYAANLANITNINELVDLVFARYIETNPQEYPLGKDQTPFEYGVKIINEFLRTNQALNNFNEKQRIILVAGEFDDQTLSSVAWLNKNSLDISCYTLEPYIINKETIILPKKILPLMSYNDFFVNIPSYNNGNFMRVSTKNKRESLPRIEALIRWDILKTGQQIYARDFPNEIVTLKANGQVITKSKKEMSLHDWLKSLYKWSSVQSYYYAYDLNTKKSLSDLRREFMDSPAYESVKDDW